MRSRHHSREETKHKHPRDLGSFFPEVPVGFGPLTTPQPHVFNFIGTKSLFFFSDARAAVWERELLSSLDRVGVYVVLALPALGVRAVCKYVRSGADNKHVSRKRRSTQNSFIYFRIHSVIDTAVCCLRSICWERYVTPTCVRPDPGADIK